MKRIIDEFTHIKSADKRWQLRRKQKGEAKRVKRNLMQYQYGKSNQFSYLGQLGNIKDEALAMNFIPIKPDASVKRFNKLIEEHNKHIKDVMKF